MQAVILAGGYGTRLAPLTYTRAKPMLPILNKPMVRHLMDSLPQETEIILATNYKTEQIKKYFKEQNREIIINREPEPLGTGGATKYAEDYINGTFMVLNGDIISSLNIRKFIRFHKKNKAMATISLWPVKNVWEFGVVALKPDGRITKFVEKPSRKEAPSNLINAGAYCLEPEILDYIEQGRMVSMEKEIFPKIIKEGKRFYGHTFDGFWIDVGRPASYIEANKILLKRNGISYITGKNCIVKGKLEDSCIGNGTEVGTESKINSSVIYENSTIGPNAFIDNCIIGSDCSVGSNTLLRNVIVGDGEKIEEKKKLENMSVWNKPVPEGYPDRQIGNALKDG
ncbi:MAG: NDP-sugar synthase [Candidatus Thermoplasmatota archaeon]|nr:NDP-sugar synthase [Candidatus Thermoplasmatota archaeon]